MNVVVVQGDTDEDLRRGAGHIPGTSLPGAKGNVGIAAHRDTFFRPLRNIRRGDVIELSNGNSKYLYRVNYTEIVRPDRSDVLDPTAFPSLTVVTCYPFYYVGPAPKRFIVHAEEIPPDSPMVRRYATVGN